jgi:hypothetical protein
MHKTTFTTDLERELDAALHTVLDEVDALRAENQRLIDWITGEGGPDALTTLQAIYSSPDTSIPDKIKSSGIAVHFERSKPASVVVQVDFKQRVHDARMRTLELRRQEWARQDAAKDLDPPPTILGEAIPRLRRYTHLSSGRNGRNAKGERRRARMYSRRL